MEKKKEQKQAKGGGKAAKKTTESRPTGWLDRHMPAIAWIAVALAVIIGTILIVHFTK